MVTVVVLVVVRARAQRARAAGLRGYGGSGPPAKVPGSFRQAVQHFGRGDDTVGSPRRARLSQF